MFNKPSLCVKSRNAFRVKKQYTSSHNFFRLKLRSEKIHTMSSYTVKQMVVTKALLHVASNVRDSYLWTYGTASERCKACGLNNSTHDTKGIL